VSCLCHVCHTSRGENEPETRRNRARETWYTIC
jgi:hypothetical protein